MAITEIDVANRALALLGADPITQFDDADSQESQWCSILYDGLVESWLTMKPWRFAMKQAELDRLVDTPIGRWAAAYQQPSDMLVLKAITINGHAMEYDRYNDMIYCDATENDTLVADYIFKAGPQDWPPYFTQAFVFAFAAMLGGALARDAALVDKYDQLAEKSMQRASSLDAQSQTSKRIISSRYISVRGNSRTGNFRDDGY